MSPCEQGHSTTPFTATLLASSPPPFPPPSCMLLGFPCLFYLCFPCSLSVFDGTSGYLRAAVVTSDDIRKAVISTIGSLDAPMSPDTKGYV